VGQCNPERLWYLQPDVARDSLPSELLDRGKTVPPSESGGSCPEKLDRFEVEDCASCGLGTVGEMTKFGLIQTATTIARSLAHASECR